MYHKITEDDCLSVATKIEKDRLSNILDFALLKTLARRWCDNNGFTLGGYLGHSCWDSNNPE